MIIMLIIVAAVVLIAVAAALFTLCGQERNHGDSWHVVANARTDLSLMPSLKRRRLCLRCLDLLADLNTLTEGEPDA